MGRGREFGREGDCARRRIRADIASAIRTRLSAGHCRRIVSCEMNMPTYDRLCFACGWVAVDVLEPMCCDPSPCPECGAVTERAWLTKPPNVVGDEVDFVSRNGEKHPVRFRSRADHRRWLNEKGLRIQDDKSGHS